MILYLVNIEAFKSYMVYMISLFIMIETCFIHIAAIIGKCIDLPFEMYPFLSNKITKYILKRKVTSGYNICCDNPPQDDISQREKIEREKDAACL